MNYTQIHFSSKFVCEFGITFFLHIPPEMVNLILPILQRSFVTLCPLTVIRK